ncbi:MAG TPA: hypothetical protein VHQ47_10345 [Phycisphaerae bacterium]|jgi:hypothetical protein|nr:hypothetical protein [Phycisphaerae bacterium]
MQSLPVVHDGVPFILVPNEERENTLRRFARAGVALILSPEGNAHTRMEFPGHDSASARSLLRRLHAQDPDHLPDPLAAVMEIRCAAAGTKGPLFAINRAKVLGLLED